jgi:carbon storage regulator CsrA
VVLDVEALNKKQDEACRHLCRKGCGIYSERPGACRDFTCAWLNGLLGPADRPDRTKHVIWSTALIRWLMDKSFVVPVTIVEGTHNELYHYGAHIVSWENHQFIRLDFDEAGKRIIGARVVDKAEAVPDAEARKNWEAAMHQGSAPEDDPELEAERQEFVKRKAADWLDG